MAAEHPKTLEFLAAELEWSEKKTAGPLHQLEQVSDLKVDAHEGVAFTDEQPGEAARLAIEMAAYSELTTCRREYLLQHFGADAANRCDYCDNCEANPLSEVNSEHGRSEPEVVEGDQQPFPVKSRVEHQQLGRGLVEGYDGDKVKVLFDNAGHKGLSLPVLVERGLLVRAL